MKNNLFIIVLAAGKGTRLNATDKPKAMYPINGKPMVGYFADLISKIAPKKKIFVVGFYGQQVVDYMSYLGDYEFVWQEEQLGTGHAVAKAQAILGNLAGTTVVINVDNPFFKPETIFKLVEQITNNDAVIAIATVKLDPSYYFGRVITDNNNHIKEIVEVKNATPEQLKISTMNAGLYVFNNKWLWENIKKINLDRIYKEYCLPDLVKIAVSNGKKVVGVEVSHKNEAIGINTLQNLELAEQAIK